MIFFANVITVQTHTLGIIKKYCSSDGVTRLGIFSLVTSLILLTYSHRPIILRFDELNKILW